MIYFDSDVLVHCFFDQDVEKQTIARQNTAQSAELQSLTISVLTLQEVSFVLNKLKLERDEISYAIDAMNRFDVKAITPEHFERARQLALKVGFQHVNDCLHTAIAEEFCTELQTFNRDDFKRIQPHTSLKINIL